MKTLLTSAALAAMLATGASATATVVGASGLLHWTGIPTLPDMCEFRQLKDGKMDLDETTGVWTVDSTQPAEVTVAYRGINKISVEPDDSKSYQTSHQYNPDGSLAYGFGVNNGNGVIHGHAPGSTHGEVFDANVEYSGSTYETTQDGGKVTAKTVTGSPGSFEVSIPRGTEFAGVAEIKIHGTAKPTGIAIYTSGDEYHTPHKITCLQ